MFRDVYRTYGCFKVWENHLQVLARNLPIFACSKAELLVPHRLVDKRRGGEADIN